jgi:uncharacterized membrane protein YbhN (UPF0104 family)
MKKLIKKISKKTWRITTLLLLGNIVFIVSLIFLSTKEQIAKTDWEVWLVTVILYWVFWATIWFAKKTQPLFDEVIRVGFVEPFGKQFKE